AGTGVGSDHFFRAGKWLRVTAAHHCEHAIFGAGLAARYRGVNEIETVFLRRSIKVTCDFSRGGRMVDEDLALAHAGESAIWPQGHFTQVIVITNAGHDEILALSSGLGGRG